MMQHRARKRFGQNFLSDPQVIDRIIQAINAKANDNLLEIGPGLGALTFELLECVNSMTAIELDRDLCAHLTEKTSHQNKLTLISDDVLNIDLSQFGNNLRIVGNLPYNVSTPVIMHALNAHDTISDMIFMLQKEVVTRMSAQPGTKAYGRLSVVLQYVCEVIPLFDVDPTSFTPAPKVNSQMIRLVPYKTSPFKKTCFLTLQNVVRQAFSSRRKTLKNNLKSLLSDDAFVELDIDPSQRPEQVPVADYVSIADMQVNRK